MLIHSLIVDLIYSLLKIEERLFTHASGQLSAPSYLYVRLLSKFIEMDELHFALWLQNHVIQKRKQLISMLSSRLIIKKLFMK